MGLPHTVIGLDLGSSFGWAELDVDGDRIASGHWRLGKGRERWGAIHTLLGDRIAAAVFGAGGADDVVVCYESVPAGAMAKIPQWGAVYHGLRSIVELLTLQHSVVAYSLRYQQWKKTAAGNGNASKPTYVAAAARRYGLDLEVTRRGDEDEAAALGVAYACYIELGGVQRPIAGEQVTL